MQAFSLFLLCIHPQHNTLSMHINMHYTPSNTLPTAFHNPPMHTTKKTSSWQNGTRCRDGVNVLWCHSHLVQLDFEGKFHPYMCLFSFRKLFRDLYIQTDKRSTVQKFMFCLCLYKAYRIQLQKCTCKHNAKTMHN